MARKKKGETQLSIYLPVTVHAAFKQMAGDLGVSMNDFIRDFIKSEVLRRGYFLPRKPVPQYSTVADLVQDTIDYLQDRSKLTTASLQLMAKGEEPSEVDFLKLAVALKIEQGELDALFERSFPNSKNMEKQKWT